MTVFELTVGIRDTYTDRCLLVRTYYYCTGGTLIHLQGRCMALSDWQVFFIIHCTKTSEKGTRQVQEN